MPDNRDDEAVFVDQADRTKGAENYQLRPDEGESLRFHNRCSRWPAPTHWGSNVITAWRKDLLQLHESAAGGTGHRMVGCCDGSLGLAVSSLRGCRGAGRTNVELFTDGGKPWSHTRTKEAIVAHFNETLG